MAFKKGLIVGGKSRSYNHFLEAIEEAISAINWAVIEFRIISFSSKWVWISCLQSWNLLKVLLEGLNFDINKSVNLKCFPITCIVMSCWICSLVHMLNKYDIWPKLHCASGFFQKKKCPTDSWKCVIAKPQLTSTDLYFLSNVLLVNWNK